LETAKKWTAPERRKDEKSRFEVKGEEASILIKIDESSLLIVFVAHLPHIGSA